MTTMAQGTRPKTVPLTPELHAYVLAHSAPVA